MAYEISIQAAAPQSVAVVRDRVTLRDLSTRLIPLLTRVWNFLRKEKIANPGINVVVYLDTPDACLLLTPEGVPLEAGAFVSAPFASNGDVVPSATPGGQVATTIHMGPYDGLHAAHAAIRDWCQKNHHALAGPNWEVYGHWHDDPAQRRTDVFYLLR